MWFPLGEECRIAIFLWWTFRLLIFIFNSILLGSMILTNNQVRQTLTGHFSLGTPSYWGAQSAPTKYPHTTTTPSPAWTFDTKQDGSTCSCSLCQIQTRPSEYGSWHRDSSEQATFFQSSVVQLWWFCVNFSLTFLSWADRRGTDVLSCCCSSSTALLGCYGWMFWVARCLCIIWNQSAHSPLTSHIKEIILFTQLPLAGCLLLFWT